MFRLSLSVVMGLMLVFGSSALAADKPVHGTITKVDKDGGNITLTVTLAVKKKDANASAEKTEKKYTIKSDAKVEKVTGKKGEEKHTDAKIEDLKEGVAGACDREPVDLSDLVRRHGARHLLGRGADVRRLRLQCLSGGGERHVRAYPLLAAQTHGQSFEDGNS